jgi:CSLREA domain-containing protein
VAAPGISRRIAVVLSAWLIVLATSSVASADTFSVNTPTDHLPNGCDAADCTLREAVNAAANGDTVNVPANTYVLSNQFGGELLIDANMTIVGAGARQTIIDANLGSRVMRVAPPVGTPAPVPVTASVSGVTLTRGSGVGGNNPNGGALHVAFNATLTLTDSAVTNSRSQTGNGGGIFTDGTLTLNRATVSGNEAVGAAAPANGGGIFHSSNNDPARIVTITNSTISGNSTNGNGGGIYSAAGVLGLQSTTIAGNTAGSGSALFKPGSGTAIQDSILAAAGTACAGAGVAGIVGSNNMATDGSCGATATQADPLLGPLTNNGGPTDTQALAAASPAIGAASPAPDRCTGSDQRGVPRPQGGSCDIGAYEFSVTQPGGGEQLPPPVAGKNVNLLPKSGTVKVKLPGRKRFRTLSEGEQLPVGTTVDTRKGRVTLVAAGGQSADFYDGIFKIRQGKGAKPLTTLTLTQKLSCPKAGNAIAAAKKKKRRLWGNGSGRFRTKGKHSAATVVGTKWLVEDRCKSTLTRVVRGRVSVRDFATKETVIVKRGKRYIARAG